MSASKGSLTAAQIAAMPTAAALRAADSLVILSHGMGVETAAIFKRWVEDPESRPFKSWDRLIVVTSQVGEEVDETIRLMETHQLPEMKRLGVRFVELARRGHLEADGIVVLQDTREPVKMHPLGQYRLTDELLFAGTVPQFSGEHRCALKFKAFVIETWMAWALRGETAVHVFGYNNVELTRIAKSDFHIARHNADRSESLGEHDKAPIVVFGFNNVELGRVARSMAYDGPHRTGNYPLLEWAWGRQECLDYLLKHYGVAWIKSACAGCPFNEEAYKSTALGIERFAKHPTHTAHWLFVEHVSMCLNPKGQLYQKRTMASVVKGSPRLKAVWEMFQTRLAESPWALYQVRRIFTLDQKRHDTKNKLRKEQGKKPLPPKAGVARAIRVLEKGTMSQMQQRVKELTTDGHAAKSSNGIDFAYFQEKGPAFPTCEGYIVAAPQTVQDKVRGPVNVFDMRFDQAVLATGQPTKKISLPVVDDYFGV